MKKRTISENIAKVVIISKAPDWAKMIVDAIPDLTYDYYLKNYKAIWSIALPASAVLAMNQYVETELGKTFVAHMSAGIARAINDRAKSSINVLKEFSETNVLGNDYVALGSAEQTNYLTIRDCLYLLNSWELELVMKRICSLPEEQRNNLLAVFVPGDEVIKSHFETVRSIEKALSKKILKLSYPKILTKVDFLRALLVDCTDKHFRDWAATTFDEKRKAKQWKMAKKIAREKYNIKR